MPINDKGKMSNSTVENSGSCHLSQVIREQDQQGDKLNCVSPRKMQQEEHNISSLIFLPMMHNLTLIIRKHWKNPNLE